MSLQKDKIVAAHKQSQLTVSLYLTQQERSELNDFSAKYKRRIKLGRLYADGVLAKIREFDRNRDLIAAGRTQIDPSLLGETRL